MIKSFRIGLYCIIVAVSLGCFPAFAQDGQDADLSGLMEEYETDSAHSKVPDPLYRYNKVMYHFNDRFYYWGLKPVASGYKRALPGDVRKCVRNFFTNALFPVRFVNCLLQGKIKSAGEEFGIFTVNTTVGCFGLGRPAQDEFAWEISKEDFGQTLGSYSIKQGFYIIWPVLGPSTLRDTVGRAGDYFLTPVNYLKPARAVYGLKALDTVNSTSFRLGDYEAVRQGAVDPYAALKSAYIQHRAKRVNE
ncbi:MAG: VacJ family lipoprotein [Desulfobacteraceae bacterium]